MRKLSLFLVLLFSATPAFASNWAESIHGELSGDGAAPTPLVFDFGINHISGTMGTDLPSVPPDRDIFTFTLAPGQALTSINVVTYTPTNRSFYAISGAATITTSNASNHLSNTLVSGLGDILPQLALGSYSGGTPGLTDPLPAGTYSIWFQELSSVVTYDIAYTVDLASPPVPEPGAMGVLALPILACRRRRHGFAV